MRRCGPCFGELKPRMVPGVSGIKVRDRVEGCETFISDKNLVPGRFSASSCRAISALQRASVRQGARRVANLMPRANPEGSRPLESARQSVDSNRGDKLLVMARLA